MITADVAVRGFVFVLAVLAMVAVTLLPPLAALVLVHRHTCRAAACWLWLAGFLVYAAGAAVSLTALVINTGFAAWAGP